MKKLLAAAALLFSIGAVASENVEVHDIRAIKIGGIKHVEGIAHNSSNTTLRSITVNFKLYDNEGNVIGNALAVGQDIGPGENFKFSAVTTLDFAEAKLSGVEAR